MYVRVCVLFVAFVVVYFLSFVITLRHCVLQQTILKRAGLGRATLRQYAADLSKAKHREIEANVKKDPVVLFMKGNATQPRCGFSGGAVQILNSLGLSSSQVEYVDCVSHFPVELTRACCRLQPAKNLRCAVR